jgi:ribosome-binding ATPase YchF (GTP1/OBG family)
MANKVKEHLQLGELLTSFGDQDDPVYVSLDKELRFLTAKPVIYGANVAEEYLSARHPSLDIIKGIANKHNAEVVQISALLESELNVLNDNEKSEYMAISGIEISGLEQVIQIGYKTLNLISFFTFNDHESRAWTVRDGATAPEAAGQIHTDFQEGFIKAEVIPFEIFEEFGSTASVKEAGKLQIEGKEYIVQDGDVIFFRFSD